MGVSRACFVVMVIYMVVATTPNVKLAEGALTCGQVTGALAPCLAYLRTQGSVPVPVTCCNGVRGLNRAARTTVDRRTACNCLKQTATAISDLNLNAAVGLPGKCGVNIPYKISPSTDCNRVV
ncbi:Non-specific lipid-transfer protein [Heracleum sosnowskyi]|uniref:Non-specific lipid-transfer protein n=1 Tax=Heracleum sosnowskyi TaxID=360622 RepID=A0AAD8M0Z0_9APIA|nr:Non-specific lipid-transfer protein [Heracleum sosnowskyi]